LELDEEKAAQYPYQRAFMPLVRRAGGAMHVDCGWKRAAGFAVLPAIGLHPVDFSPRPAVFIVRPFAGRRARCLGAGVLWWDDAAFWSEEGSRKAVAGLLAYLVLPVLLSVSQPWAPGPVALPQVTVIDGTGAKPRRDQTVLIAGDRIAAIGTTG